MRKNVDFFGGLEGECTNFYDDFKTKLICGNHFGNMKQRGCKITRFYYSDATKTDTIGKRFIGNFFN